jgi:predicted SprT family Zn-dependent metalloprotease
MNVTQEISIIENSEEIPLCPHCEKSLTALHSRKIRTRLGVRFVYFCGRCKKTIGVSDRKSFLMG